MSAIEQWALVSLNDMKQSFRDPRCRRPEQNMKLRCRIIQLVLFTNSLMRFPSKFFENKNKNTIPAWQPMGSRYLHAVSFLVALSSRDFQCNYVRWIWGFSTWRFFLHEGDAIGYMAFSDSADLFRWATVEMGWEDSDLGITNCCPRTSAKLSRQAISAWMRPWTFRNRHTGVEILKGYSLSLPSPMSSSLLRALCSSYLWNIACCEMAIFLLNRMLSSENNFRCIHSFLVVWFHGRSYIRWRRVVCFSHNGQRQMIALIWPGSPDPKSSPRR